jgi:tetratricopeptide (TPR) repeat protein
MSGLTKFASALVSELERAATEASRVRREDAPQEVLDLLDLSPEYARERERIPAAGMRDMEQAAPEVLAQELAVYGDEEAVLAAFVQRRMVEERKARANALFAAGKWEDALLLYNVALTLCFGCFAKRSPLDRRLIAVLLSNRAACFLSLGNFEKAAEEARAAVKEDETFEKAWLRLGAALEASPGGRKEAVEAYRRVSSNEVAAKRIAALEAPRIEVTTEGLMGVRDGSLDLDTLKIYLKPTAFFVNRIFLPSEPLVLTEARANAPDYVLRFFMMQLSQRVEELASQGMRHRSHFVFLQEDDPDNSLCLDVLGNFFTLSDVVEDGRSRMVAHNASEIPAILVAFRRGRGEMDGGWTIPLQTFRWKDLKPFTDMLTRNASLLSDATRAKWGPYAPGLTLSVLTHVAAAELDYSVFEGCAVPGCTVECAGFRCGRCFVARYCGKEHMTAHWKVHKSKCVPLERRFPRLAIDCSRSYLDDPENARDRNCDCVSVPKKTFPGVVVVKVQMSSDSAVKVSDPNGVTSACASGDTDWARLLKQALRARGPITGGAYGYFDADMSQEGRIVILLDHNWKCTW